MNKRFQDSFKSRVQLEYASLLLAGGLVPNISASVDLQAESSSNTLRFFSLVGWRPISLEKKKCEMMNKFLIRTSFFYPYSACSLSKVSI